jgi:hypothetical protein
MQVLNSVTDLPNLFDNLAASITNNLRLNDEEATVVHGTSAVIVYRIRWVYIILPALSTFGGSIFFLLSVWYTYRLHAPLWKSSAVAILKCGATLNGFARDQDRVSELDGLAKMTGPAVSVGRRVIHPPTDLFRQSIAILRATQSERRLYASDVNPELQDGVIGI